MSPGRERVSPVGPGDRVGDFEIIEELGRGGMGVVYRAKDLVLPREVALKCPWPSFASEEQYRRRFLREAKASSRLSHPNIVPVISAFEDRGLPWMTLLLVDGRSLRDVLGRTDRPLPITTVLHYGEGVAMALSHAHDKHILHRDVSTNNILITRDERALLTDFGLARVLPPDEIQSIDTTVSVDLTTEGALVGTIRYMSPEQALGRHLDRRSDIFSLGSVLYEMCTGVPAFSPSASGSLLDSVINQHPAPMRQFNYDVDEELEHVVRKAMSKRPDERHQNADELKVDLVRIRRRLESGVVPGSLEISRDEPRGGRRPWIAAAALIPVAALALWIALDRNPASPPTDAESLQVTSSAGWEGYPAISPDGGRIAFTSDRSGTMDIWVVDATGGEALQLTSGPAADVRPSWFPDGHALLFESDRDGTSAVWQVGQLGGGVTLIQPRALFPAVSPDGERIAFSRADSTGDLRIWVAVSKEPSQARQLTFDDGAEWDHIDPSWSPDGKWICYSNWREIWKVPADGGAPVKVSRADARHDGEPVWSADGKAIYFASYREGSLALWRMTSDGKNAHRITPGTGPESQPTASRDGLRLAYSTHSLNHDLVLLDLASGQTASIPGETDEWQCSLAPDASFLIFQTDRWGQNFDFARQELTGGMPDGPPRRLTNFEGDVSHPAVSPDGRWIACYRILDDERDIYVFPSDGGVPVRFTTDAADDIQPAWSPDGSKLVFVSERGGASQLWVAPFQDGRRAGEPVRITDDSLMALAPAWSPDGGTIAFVGSRGRAMEAWVVPADGGEQARALTQGAGAHRIRWSSAGDAVIVSGAWGRGELTMRKVSLDGRVQPFHPEVVFGSETAIGSFDISRSGGHLVFSRQNLRGNIWMLQARHGRY